MPSNKLRNVIIIGFTAAVVIGGHLLPGLSSSPIDDNFRNGLHVLVFAIVAIILYENLLLTGYDAPVVFLLTIVTVAVVGGVAELLQYWSGWQLDILDVARDVAGGVLALTARMLWRSSKDAGNSVVVRRTARYLSVALGILVVTPMMFWLSIMALGRMSSPVILDFSQWWNEYIYRSVNAEIILMAGELKSADINLRSTQQSGLVVSPMVTDWSDYEFLTITAGMTSGPRTNVTVRINDGDRRNDWKDEFLAPIVVEAVVSTIRIPLEDLIFEPGQAEVDLSDVREIVIYARDRRSNTVMRIESLRLE